MSDHLRHGLLRHTIGILDRVGRRAVTSVRGPVYVAATASGVLLQTLRLCRAWPRTVRAALARQVLYTGVQSSFLICGVGFLIGVLVVSQYQRWVGGVIESRYLASAVAAIIFREAGPLLVNILLVARAGAAMTTQLGLMTALGEVRALEAQGLDAVGYLLMPRVCGMTAAACLTSIFLAASLAGAYLCGS